MAISVKIALVLLTAACPNLSSAVGQALPVISNSSNELDFIGQLHNEGLDYVIGHKTLLGTSPLLWDLRVQQLTQEFICSKTSYIEAKIAGMTPGTQPESCEMKEVEVNAMGQLNLLLLKSGSMGLRDFVESVKVLEATIATYSLTNRQKITLLGACSVARYSAFYWYAETGRPTSEWTNPPGEPPEPLVASWGQVAAWDAGGAVVGAMNASPAAFAGPIGWGAIGTAAVGCACTTSAGRIVAGWLS